MRYALLLIFLFTLMNPGPAGRITAEVYKKFTNAFAQEMEQNQ